MLILGIETSCDDTCLALVQDGKKVLAEVRTSQEDAHAAYGGVVPELAARMHADAWPSAFGRLLDSLNWEIEDLKEKIDAIAVTQGPGLQTSLLTGTTLANMLGLLLHKPVIPVHHILGHVYSVLLGRDQSDFAFPALCLTLSGGHTQLFLVKDWQKVELLSKTRDDACGEAYDKVARALGLGYPGGPVVSRLADEGDAKKYAFPRPLEREKTLDFSFSGLKAAVIRLIDQKGLENLTEQDKKDICAGFQASVLSICTRRVGLAYDLHPDIANLWLVGGVSANVQLKKVLKRWADEHALSFFHPKERKHSTDNAAMIATAGYLKYKRGYAPKNDSLSPNPRLKI